MEEVAGQLLIGATVLVACFIGPFIAGFLLIRRRKMARRARRSPIGIDLLRSPGHSLREQLETLHADSVWEYSLLMSVPPMLLALFLAQGHWLGFPRMLPMAPVYVAIVLAFIAYEVRKLMRCGVLLDNLKAGYDAELAVGQELDQLMRLGAAVFHDVPANNFNIDHVVVSTSGVFAVETKGFTKLNRGRGKADARVVFDGKALSFPAWTTSEPIEQADRQARWLAKWLGSAVGSAVVVRPVLALPGWFVERTQRGAVQVLSGKELPWMLKNSASSLAAQDVQRLAHQVEQRCRTVAPRYREDKKKPD
jgi:hypothetical protein